MTENVFTPLIMRQRAIQVKIVDAARAVIPALLDAGRIHTAKPLQELFFELDALEQEMQALIKSDPEAMFALLTRLAAGGPE